ncbi:MAG: alpha/beta fold hydrolase [Methyloligellaceae bacterium]
MIKKIFRYLVYFIVLLAVLAVGAFFYLKTPDSDPETVRAKYTNQLSKFADNGKGMKVHYRDEGNKDGMPLVLIHGSSASLHTFEPMAKYLTDKYRVISLTLPGHGLTGPHPQDNYSFEGYAEAVDLVSNELKLEKFALAGNSLGGWITWRYALKNKDKVNALILLDAGGMPLRKGEIRPPQNLAFRLARHSFGRFLIANITPRSLVKKSLLQTVSVKESVTEDIVDRYYDLVRLPGNRRAGSLRRQTFYEKGALAKAKKIAERAKEIKAPTLIIWGKEDQLVYASAAQSFKERITQAEVIIYDGVGHLPMEEAPERTAKDIDAFLSKSLKKEEPEQKPEETGQAGEGNTAEGKVGE